MKRVYIIKTINLSNPMEYGWMKESGKGSKPTQVKQFKSKYGAKRYLKDMKKNLKVGWAHIILPSYIQKKDKEVRDV